MSVILSDTLVCLRGWGITKRGENMPEQQDEKEKLYTIEEAMAAYTREQATEVLSRNAKTGREVYPDYVRTLGRNGKIRTAKINDRLTLYHKEDVDHYIVEVKGLKAGKLATERAAHRKATGPRDASRSPKKKT
jgi:hypothetical protein